MATNQPAAILELGRDIHRRAIHQTDFHPHFTPACLDRHHLALAVAGAAGPIRRSLGVPVVASLGGEYAFLSRLYHPILGFLSGWVSFFVGFSAPIAASAIGFSEYLTRAFPGLLHLGLIPGSLEATIMKKLYAVLIIAAFTFLHTRGLEAGARVQNALTGLKILLIVGLVIAAQLLDLPAVEQVLQLLARAVRHVHTYPATSPLRAAAIALGSD